MQKNLFGFGNTHSTEKKTVSAKPKAAFPQLALIKGLNKQEASSEAIFLHRILINKSIRQENAKQFLAILSNEVAIKKGKKDSFIATLDSLKQGC